MLLTRRPDTMAFAPGMHVFPGGRLDPRDADPLLEERSVLRAEDAAGRLAEALEPRTALGFFVAALREAFEEVGVLLARPAASDDGARRGGMGTAATGRAGSAAAEARLVAVRDDLLRGATGLPEELARLGLALRTDLLVPVARWITPPTFPRRFDARFLAAPFPDGALVSPDPREVVDARWVRPSDALAEMRAGAISLWLPTACTLGILESLRAVDELQSRPPLAAVLPPRLEEVADGVLRLEVTGAGGVPGRRATGAVVGRREVVVVDPGDALPASLEALLSETGRRGLRVVAIAVTRVDAEHAAGASDLSARLGVPAYCGPGGAGWLPAPFVELDEGSLVPAGDVPLRVAAVDPADRGRVALDVGAAGPRIDETWTAERGAAP